MQHPMQSSPEKNAKKKKTNHNIPIVSGNIQEISSSNQIKILCIESAVRFTVRSTLQSCNECVSSNETPNLKLITFRKNLTLINKSQCIWESFAWSEYSVTVCRTLASISSHFCFFYYFFSVLLWPREVLYMLERPKTRKL